MKIESARRREYCQVCRNNTWHDNGGCEVCQEHWSFDGLTTEEKLSYLSKEIEALKLAEFARATKEYLEAAKQFRKDYRSGKGDRPKLLELERQLWAMIRKVLG